MFCVNAFHVVKTVTNVNYVNVANVVNTVTDGNNVNVANIVNTVTDLNNVNVANVVMVERLTSVKDLIQTADVETLAGPRSSMRFNMIGLD